MEEDFQLILFGDLTFEFSVGLQQLATRHDNPLLVAFFEQVAYALRGELGKLSFHERKREGTLKFTNFVELLYQLKESRSSHPATEKALICSQHFARFIE